MDRFVKLNNKGMGLVEVMIALTVMLLVFLALMQTALVSIDANMLNTMRGEAVNVAELRMNKVRTDRFDAIVSDGPLINDPNGGCTSVCNDCPDNPNTPAADFATGACICSDVRSIENFKYCTNVTSTALGADNRRIDVMVGWKWKGEDYFHTISTIRKR